MPDGMRRIDVSQFQDLVDRGLDRLSGALEQSHGGAESAELTRLVGGLNLPALLGLLGTSQADPPDGRAALREVAAGVAAALGDRVDADEVERVLSRVFLEGAPPDAVHGDRSLRDEILEKAVAELASRAGVPVTPEQARRAARLLATGEFYRDVGDATAAVLFNVEGLPVALHRDIGSGPLRLGQLAFAVIRDLGGAVGAVPSIMSDLRDGRLDQPPKVMGNTLRTLYGFASLRSTVEMICTLIAEENESVRLAIVVYARANGIPIEDADLTTLRDTALDPDRPDLGPALAVAFDRLTKKQDLDSIKDALSRMSRETTA